MTRIGFNVLAFFVASHFASDQALAQRPRSVAFSAIAGSGIATALTTGQDGSIFVTGFRPDTRGTNQFPFTARIGDGPGRTFIVKLDPAFVHVLWRQLL